MGASARASPDLSPQTPRFLQTAEMVKPSTPSPSHESSSLAGSDEGTEYYPHLGERLAGDRRGGQGEERGKNQGHSGEVESWEEGSHKGLAISTCRGPSASVAPWPLRA